MSYKFIIVEDQPLLAMAVEDAVTEQGHIVVCVAADTRQAMACDNADIALVDVNLTDGPTGPEIGSRLANERGMTVLFMTSDPARLARGVPGTVGIVPKPVFGTELAEVIDYLARLRSHLSAIAPSRMLTFA